MREIKFRAWDKERDEYLSAGMVLISIHRGRNPVNKIWLDILDKPDLYRDRFIIEQSTGLKDADGVEIFEGDVVHIHALSGDFYNAEVKWSSEYGCWIMTVHEPFFHSYYFNQGQLKEKPKVIGNVWEGV